MNDTVVGSCSVCGGSVMIPRLWLGVVPPTPTCRSCGATKRAPKPPVIDMQPRRTWKQR